MVKVQFQNNKNWPCYKFLVRKDLNLALNHDTSYHLNIKMTENIKFLTSL